MCDLSVSQNADGLAGLAARLGAAALLRQESADCLLSCFHQYFARRIPVTTLVAFIMTTTMNLQDAPCLQLQQEPFWLLWSPEVLSPPHFLLSHILASAGSDPVQPQPYTQLYPWLVPEGHTKASNMRKTEIKKSSYLPTLWIWLICNIFTAKYNYSMMFILQITICVAKNDTKTSCRGRKIVCNRI